MIPEVRRSNALRLARLGHDDERTTTPNELWMAESRQDPVRIPYAYVGYLPASLGAPSPQRHGLRGRRRAGPTHHSRRHPSRKSLCTYTYLCIQIHIWERPPGSGSQSRPQKHPCSGCTALCPAELGRPLTPARRGKEEHQPVNTPSEIESSLRNAGGNTAAPKNRFATMVSVRKPRSTRSVQACHCLACI
ncbi:hypothetical protein GGS23DRAFT_587484 [Durotheca rogersii]|uniref:uncharacterized protein n=1 Tax=Durotheca rogersii TaxID=419775 RepID=UPI00221F267A|nr:uncharacterized protein GGS23DRAFT_587484 [Durotheca rogersii]KAI5857451.1 hypothetical protein GGS23DRAFT_587484 [Durotheca rogersii]